MGGLGLVGLAMGALGSGAANAAAPDTVQSQAARFTVEAISQGLEAPVALTVLPDGRGLLAQRAIGSFGYVDLESGGVQPIQGLPPVHTEGDAGALDVALHPRYGENGWVYLAYAELTPSGPTTVLDRARLDGGRWVDRERLFTAITAGDMSVHYGGRIVLEGGYVFLTIGDRDRRDEAQSLRTHNGTVVRLMEDGSVPADNPFVQIEGALPEIWSYGHRNAQGLALNPATGALWLNEHGPQGGDELNIVRPGRNYGWPRITWGEEYGGGPVGRGWTAQSGMEQPVWLYLPSIGPSDLVFPMETAFEGWHSSALVGAMALTHLNRLTLDGDRVIHEERLLEDRGWRIRMIEPAPDGSIILGTDSGELVRLRATPNEPGPEPVDGESHGPPA